MTAIKTTDWYRSELEKKDPNRSHVVAPARTRDRFAVFGNGRARRVEMDDSHFGPLVWTLGAKVFRPVIEMEDFIGVVCASDEMHALSLVSAMGLFECDDESQDGAE